MHKKKLYAVYFTEPGTIGLDLSAASSSLSLTWYDPKTGSWSDSVVALEPGPQVKITADFAQDMAAFIK